ncbi:MAG: hypothetical protein LBB84_02570 [Tannerellaceae bacterium]|jgi:hypothetical protein|nr:hypothetical protein [Tannerellaceae bacterium]
MKTFHIIMHLLFGLAIVAGIGAVVMWLWNWLTPAIWGWPVLHFGQALGLFALCRILFGGSIGGGKIWGSYHLKPYLHDKWRKWTPEEREEFIRRRHFHHSFDHFNALFSDEKKSEKND